MLVKVERALELISPAYDLGRSEQEVRTQWQAYFARLNEKERYNTDETDKNAE